ncbi:unnamed protein product [Pedinophyceae sp. YPF-701]|nr:unnamed protein product [Pedinophyceae sp. YPF-701]
MSGALAAPGGADANAQLDRFEEALDEMQEIVRQLTEVSAGDLQRNLDPLDRAAVHLASARTINVLHMMYLRTVGRNPSENHAVQGDERRIVQKERALNKARTASAHPGAPPARLDVAAANRFVTHALPDITAEQRRKLKEAEQRAKREKELADKGQLDPQQAYADWMGGNEEGWEWVRGVFKKTFGRLPPGMEGVSAREAVERFLALNEGVTLEQVVAKMQAANAGFYREHEALFRKAFDLPEGWVEELGGVRGGGRAEEGAQQGGVRRKRGREKKVGQGKGKGGGGKERRGAGV